jgi:hypothetical protein
MKRDHLQTTRPGRPLALASAALVVALAGLLGVRFGLNAEGHRSVAGPQAEPTFHQSVFPGGRVPSAVPDHALLSASDVERALPVPSRTEGMMKAAVS